MRMSDIQLPKQFIDKFPDMKLEKAKKLHNKYLNTCRKFLSKAIPHIQGDILNFPLKQAGDICGDVIYKGTRYYVWQEFFTIQPFFYVIREGNNFHGMISEVKILDQKLIDLLIDTADTNMLVETYYSKYDTSERVNIPIDYDSLCAYISRTDHLLQNISNKDPRYGKILQNFRTAKFFKIISEYFYDQFGDYVLPHIKSDKISYGRTYYKGINLQNCSKEVRVAALGDHISYDINAAAYAIKLVLVKDIYDEFGHDFTGSFTYTKEYLDHKSEIRNELANVIHQYMPNHPNPLKLVKEAITAIGFGAKLHEGSWELDGIKRYSSLHYIIYNRKARIAFAKHKFIVNFLKEQEQLGNIIYEYYSRNTNFVDKVKNIPDIYTHSGKLNKSKVLAYLYQHMETMVMDIIVKDIIPRLRIHDSFIVDKPLTSEILKDIKFQLSQLSPYLSISNEEHVGWISQNVLDMELQHKQFIEQEELLANNGVLPIKFVRKQDKIFVQNDFTYYDGYDDGRQYDQYDRDKDDMVKDMTYQERMEHYRIIGYKKNTYPDYINKLLGDNK